MSFYSRVLFGTEQPRKSYALSQYVFAIMIVALIRILILYLVGRLFLRSLGQPSVGYVLIGMIFYFSLELLNLRRKIQIARQAEAIRIDFAVKQYGLQTSGYTIEEIAKFAAEYKKL